MRFALCVSYFHSSTIPIFTFHFAFSNLHLLVTAYGLLHPTYYVSHGLQPQTSNLKLFLIGQMLLTPLMELTRSNFYLIIYNKNDIEAFDINQEVLAMKQITLKAIYEKVANLERDIAQIKKTLIEEPELREDFILRMRNINLEKSIPVEDFGKRYGLK